MERAADNSDPPQPAAAANQPASSEQQPQNPDPNIHTLPDEVLEKIFSYLSIDDLAIRVWPVCERWQEVVQTRCMNKGLTLDTTVFSEATMVCILRATPRLQFLLVRWNDDIPFSMHRASVIVKAAAKYCRELCCLHMYSTDMALPIPILGRCPYIVDLTINSKTFWQALQFCQELGAALPKLRKLDFNTNVWFDQKCLCALVDSCPQLEELEADRCFCNDEDMKKISRHWATSLRVLQIGARDVTDAGFAALASCTQLRQLALNPVCNITGVGLQQLTVLTRLEQLALGTTHRLTATDWCQFFTQGVCPGRLRVVNLFNGTAVNDSVLAAIAATCPRLHQLLLPYCFEVTVCGVGAVLRSCSKLKHLNISSCGPGVWRSLVQNADHASQLQLLSLHFRDAKDIENALSALKAVLPNLHVKVG